MKPAGRGEVLMSIRDNAQTFSICVLVTGILGITAQTSPRQVGTGYEAWLRYDSIDDREASRYAARLPALIVKLDDSILIKTAEEELIRGVRGMLGKTLRLAAGLPEDESAILLGTVGSVKRVIPDFGAGNDITQDGYILKTVSLRGKSYSVIAGENDRGILYGSFGLLRKIGIGEPIDALDEHQNPYASVRMLDQWDNLDGTIERGYAGPSIFFEKNNVAPDLGRVRDYARLMASVGLNACSINNVNADTRVVTPEFLPQFARVAEAFRPWGVRLFAAIDFSGPQKIGGLETFDPLDQRVAGWWKKKVDEIYGLITDFGGFVLKADSEGRLGPSAYGRTHADAANVIARALKPHGGLIFYRGFVYDHHMDWRNLKNDRAKSAYDNFHELDGKFEDNVVIQIKHGPIDFQVREPVSPLFGGLEKTNMVIEVQVTQEYLGQQRHVCYLAPMWKQVLDFDMHAKDSGTPTLVKSIVSGSTFSRPIGGFV